MVLRNGSSFLVLVGLLLPGIGQAGPSNYDECILESMKGVSSDIAAQAIISSCRNLYPEQKKAATPAKAAAPQPQDIAPAPAPQAAPPASQPAPAPAPVVAGPSRDLTAAELDQLSTRLKAFGSSYTATIRNSNENLTVTEVTIAVWDESNSSTLREYPQEVMIAPAESVESRFTVHYRGDELSWAWKVASAKGYD
jgi:hypothetical protein